MRKGNKYLREMLIRCVIKPNKNRYARNMKIINQERINIEDINHIVETIQDLLRDIDDRKRNQDNG